MPETSQTQVRTIQTCFLTLCCMDTVFRPFLRNIQCRALIFYQLIDAALIEIFSMIFSHFYAKCLPNVSPVLRHEAKGYTN